jgi:hypothetical protein
MRINKLLGKRGSRSVHRSSALSQQLHHTQSSRSPNKNDPGRRLASSWRCYRLLSHHGMITMTMGERPCHNTYHFLQSGRTKQSYLRGHGGGNNITLAHIRENRTVRIYGSAYCSVGKSGDRSPSNKPLEMKTTMITTSFVLSKCFSFDGRPIRPGRT